MTARDTDRTLAAINHVLGVDGEPTGLRAVVHAATADQLDREQRIVHLHGDATAARQAGLPTMQVAPADVLMLIDHADAFRAIAECATGPCDTDYDLDCSLGFDDATSAQFHGALVVTASAAAAALAAALAWVGRLTYRRNR